MKNTIIIAFLIFTTGLSVIYAQDTVYVNYGDTVLMEKYKEGQVSLYRLKEGLNDGFYKIIYDDNFFMYGKISAGKMTGKWINKVNGVTMEIKNYDNGRLNGEQITFYENGHLKTKSSVGVDTTENPNFGFNYDSLLAFVSVKNTVILTFYQDHSIRGVSYYNHELNNLISLEYDENGKKKSRSIYFFLTKKTRITHYDSDGKVSSDYYYPPE